MGNPWVYLQTQIFAELERVLKKFKIAAISSEDLKRLLEEPPDKILSPQKNLLPYSPPKSQKDIQVSTEKESTIDKTSRKEIANGSSAPREEPQFIGVCAQCGRHIGKNEKVCMLGSKLLCTECFKKMSENR